MKYTIFALSISILSVFLVFPVFISAQETPLSVTEDIPESDLPKPKTAVTDADNPGMPWLDQATEEKLKAASPGDLGKVIALCRQAQKEGLMGENLDYCKQLMAATQIQRGLVRSRFLLERQFPKDWQAHRDQILAELEEAVTVIKDQALPFVRIAQLNLLPEGDTKRAAEALVTAETLAKNEPPLYASIIEMRAKLEKDPKKREVILAEAAKDTNNAMVLLAYAELLLGTDRVDEALELLQRAVKINPEIVNALDKVYQLLLDRGETESAMKVLDIMGKEGVNTDELALRKVRVFVQSGKNAEAVALLDELRKKHPENPEILFQRSGLHVLMESNDEAMKDIEAALRLRPNTHKYIIRKVQILTVQKKYDEAMAEARQLRSEDPENAEFILLEAQVYVAQKEYDKAVGAVRELAEKNPEEPKWQELLVRILVECEQYDQAVETVEKFHKANPDKHDLTPLLIALLAQKKQVEKVMPLIEERLKENPDDEKWILLSAQVYIEKEDYGKAIELLENISMKQPGNENLKIQLVVLYSQNKQNRKAWEILKPMIEKNPENIDFQRLKSQIMIAINRHTEAVKALEIVLKDQPDDEVTLNNLSWLLSTSPNDLIRNGNRALELALKACEMSEYKKAYILSTLAAAYAEIGDFDKAVEWSKKSLDMSKDDDNVKDRTDELERELDSFKNKKPYREALTEEEQK